MNGTNFLIETESKPEKHGFYQTIFLESTDIESAENEAVDIIRDSDLKGITKNTPDDPPMIYLEEIKEIENFDGIKSLIQGRAFYLEKQERQKK